MLLKSIHKEIDLLLFSFAPEHLDNRRSKREVVNLSENTELNCTTFLGVLFWYAKLNSLIDTPEMVVANLVQIQKIANAIQSNLMYNHIDFRSCEGLDQSALTAIVTLIKSYQGM